MWRRVSRLMNNELEMMWKEMVVELRKVLTQNLHGGVEDKHGELVRIPISGRRFKPATSRM
jgi:hypothetical protein